MKTGYYSVAIAAMMLALSANFSGTPTFSPAKDVTVIIDGSGYHPSAVTITAGQTVSWYNAERDGAHSATADDGSWDTGDMWPFATCWITFEQPGYYYYHCMHHPDETGVVVVTK
jgi:plastocyanin